MLKPIARIWRWGGWRWLRGWLLAADRAHDRREMFSRAFLSFGAVFVLSMGVVGLLGDQGLLAYGDLSRESRRLEQEIARLRARESELREMVLALRQEKPYIEYLAHRDLGLVKPGEVLVELPAQELNALWPQAPGGETQP